MKKILITLIVIFVIIISIGVNAQDEDIGIKGSILKKIKNFGVDIQYIEFAELEPDELTSYDDFSKKDYSFQKEYAAAWSTIWHDNLDKLDITVKSSSNLKGYPVTNLFDKKIETAWVEGVNGDGIGESLSIELHTKKYESPSGLEYFGMIPGYLKNDKTWKENNRVKTALLIIERQGYGNNGYFIDHAVLRLNFKDFMGLQIFKIVNYEKSISFDKRIWIIIEDVYKGTKYSDTCISEIVIKGGCALYD